MTFELQPVVVQDIPRLVTIYFNAFQNAHSQACWPRTLPVRKWWENMLLTEMREPGSTFLKIVDRSIASGICDEQSLAHEIVAGGVGPEDASIIAWAKWVAPKDGQTPDTDLPTWPEGADVALCNETFGAWAAEHVKIMGSRGHWYLELLATDPAHQGRGAGSILMSWGTERADADAREAYLEASPEGLSLYAKSGFKEASFLDTIIRSTRVQNGRDVIYRNVYMVRSSKRA